MRVAPSDDGEWHKEAQHMEDDAIGHVVRKLLVYGIVPAVLVLLDDPVPVTFAGIQR